MKRKKLLYIVEAMGGGVFSYIVDLSNVLVDEFDMYIAYSVRPQTPKDFETYFDKRITLINIKNFCREINVFKDIAAMVEIKNVVNKLKPDVVHLHSSKAGVVGRIILSGNKFSMFYTPHGYSFLMNNYSSIKRCLFKMIERICAKKNCTTICCSKGEYEESIKMGKRSLYVDNAINANKLQPYIDNVDVAEHEFTVFTIGRICHQKNPELFNAIAMRMPNVRFLWIGDGELRSELTSSNIEVTGWIEREKVLAYSMNADVFILTSLWEGLPISLLEAMYMRKLCVVSNTIGNRDVILNRKNGYICDTIEDYIRAINNNDMELIDRAFIDVMEKYEINVQARKYKDIYMGTR